MSRETLCKTTVQLKINDRIVTFQKHENLDIENREIVLSFAFNVIFCIVLWNVLDKH